MRTILLCSLVVVACEATEDPPRPALVAALQHSHVRDCDDECIRADHARLFEPVVRAVESSRCDGKRHALAQLERLTHEQNEEFLTVGVRHIAREFVDCKVHVALYKMSRGQVD